MSTAPDDQPRVTRARPWWRRRWLLLCASLAVSFVVAEAGVRWAIGAPLAERLPILEIRAHPACGWRMVAGQVHYTYQHRVQVNALGLRGPELGPKREGEVRVLALGDSLVYGQGVADQDTLPSLLAAELERVAPDAGAGWTVVNGGHRAWDTRQELALAEEVAPLVRPDVLVLFWYWNDLRERDVEATFRRLRDSGPVAFDTGAVMEGSVRWQWHLRQLLRRSALAMLLHDLLRHMDEELGELPPEEVDAGMARLDGYLAGFEALARRQGMRPLFAVIPNPLSLTGDSFTRDYDRRALEVARSRGWVALDLHQTLQQHYQDTGVLPVLPYDGHYQAVANRVMARTLAPVLAELHASHAGAR